MLKLFEKTPWLSWMTVILIGIAIFIISSTSGGGGGGGIPMLPIIYHFFIFFFFGAFVMISLVKGEKRKLFPLAILISVVYAILDELHQFFVPGRACVVSDVLVDTAGIFLAFGIYFLILEFRR